jgi:hypothetical protein
MIETGNKVDNATYILANSQYLSFSSREVLATLMPT